MKVRNNQRIFGNFLPKIFDKCVKVEEFLIIVYRKVKYGGVMLGRRIFESYARYDWTDHPRKWYWTFRIILAFVIIAACALMLTRSTDSSFDKVVYGFIIGLTLIRLPGKFKRRRIFKEAILMLKNCSQEPDTDEAYSQYQQEKAAYEQAQYEQGQQQQPVNDVKFFSSCVTKEDLDATYKKLATIYHPDQNAGNEEMFKKIQAEYAEEVLKYA